MRSRSIALALFATAVLVAVVWTVAIRRPSSPPASGNLQADASVEEEEKEDATAFAASSVPIDASVPASHPTLAATDPAVLVLAEVKGLSLGAILRASRQAGSTSTTERLYEGAPPYHAVVDVLERDLRELSARKKIGEGPDFGNHPFRPKWLHTHATRFELVGAIQRLDRRTGEASRACGELRLVYRLTADPPSRPTTRLPMTLNVLFPLPGLPGSPGSPGSRSTDPCASIAHQWRSLPTSGAERADGLVAMFSALSFDQIEVNFQNVHGPSLREDQDDHAEYVLRAFDADAKGAKPRALFNTPRPDLDPIVRQRLVDLVRDNFAAIDDGTWVVPNEFLAERVVSVTPRGLERPGNQVWSSLLPFGDEQVARALASLPYDRAKIVKSPAALLRRLEEGTCAGCHQTRAIAGFHLLGEDRVRTPLNTLATAGSPHFHEDLRWRETFFATHLNPKAQELPPPPPPRPFTSRPIGAGGYGSSCGLGDAGFAAWTCNAGLTCRSTGAATDVGLCVPTARGPGDACQTATVRPRVGVGHPTAEDGDRIQVGPVESCDSQARTSRAGGPPSPRPSDSGADDIQCSPNGFGFPGGLCSTSCDTLGGADANANANANREALDGGGGLGGAADTICVDIPSSGYESECFFVPIPIEKCIATHKARRRVRSCDEEHPCRPDFACVAVVIAASDGDSAIPMTTTTTTTPARKHEKKMRGACVPPYFVFQARVDGPMLDRP